MLTTPPPQYSTPVVTTPNPKYYITGGVLYALSAMLLPRTMMVSVGPRPKGKFNLVNTQCCTRHNRYS